jgi:catecholate siderophore receptor
MQHALTGGLEFISEEQYNPTYVGLGTPIPPANVYHPNRHDPLPDYAPVRNGVYTRGETQTFGAYLFDTLTINDQWQAIAGGRIDAYDTNFDSAVLSTAITHPTLPVGTLVPARCRPTTSCSRTRWASYSSRPRTAASTFRTPSRISRRRRELRAEQRGQQRQQSQSRSAEGDEPRARHQVGPDRGSLALNAAIYSSSNENELAVDPVDPTLFIQTGKRTVEGIELGIVGNITSDWEISAGVAEDGHRDRAGPQQPGWPADHLVARVHVHELDHLSHAIRSLDRWWRALRRTA